MSRRTAAGLLAAFGLLVFALAVGSVRLDSATSDEPAYLAAGYIKLVHGRLDFFRDQPPLMNSISAAPLVLAGYRLAKVWEIGSDQWDVGRHFLYRSGYNAHTMLLLARLPTIILFLSLCFVVYWFVARQTGSRGWGIAAFVLVGFCPNVMAHGRLATVDLPLAFFTFTATALFIVLIEQPSPFVAIGMGVSSAAAVMSKTSGNIIGPYFVLILMLAFALKRMRQPQVVLKYFGVAVAAAIGFAIVVIGLMASRDYMAASFPVLADLPIARVLVPFAEYKANIDAIRVWYEKGHTWPQFFMHEFSLQGWRRYYLGAFLLKTTWPAIAIVIAGIVAFVRRFPRRDPNEPGHRFAALALLLFALIFLAVASAGELDLGIRYVLLIYPFFYAGSAMALAEVSRELAGRRKRILGGVFVALLVWHGGENLAAYPSYISYFNETIGSHRNADEFLVDSNLDWGQDLRRLRQWTERNGIRQITVHYFGGGDVFYEFRGGPRAIRMLSPGEGPLPKGFFALSRHFYRLSFAPNTWPVNYDILLAEVNAKYVTTVGGSINVYRID